MRILLQSGSALTSILSLRGNFDGLAGVIAGLLILVASQRENRRLPVPVKVAAFRGEESARYGRAYMGSSAIFGRLTAEDLQRQQRISGETLGNSLESWALISRLSAPSNRWLRQKYSRPA